MTLLTPQDAALSTSMQPQADPDLHQPWRPRADAELLIAQLAAIDAWHRHMATAPVGLPTQSREARLDEARRLDVAQREREALHAWAQARQRDPYPFGQGNRPRAVVAHRNGWLRDKLCAALHAADVDVIAGTGDGAEASAAVVMEQPDLLFVEDLLPTLSGVELVRRARLLAPHALIGAHALGQTGVPPLAEAGARAVFSRRITPADIAAELVECLYGRATPRTAV